MSSPKCHNRKLQRTIFVHVHQRHIACTLKMCSVSSLSRRNSLMKPFRARQTTLANAVEASGIGLHTAVPVNVRLAPAPPDTGYVFRRTDLGGFEIPATVESVAHCSYPTTLIRTGVVLSTVEHILAALHGSN